jgi:DNA replication and repair protein RecF
LYIKKIDIQNFRNYKDFSYNFESQGCIITGNNGIGKSNFLEAISYFAYGKSILSNKDTELLNLNFPQGKENNFTINSQYHTDQTDINFFVRYNSKKQKLIKIHNKQIKKISELYKYIQVVYSSPNDIFNIFSTPAKRRQFLDMSIAKIYPMYINYLSNYKNALHQRNMLLKMNYNHSEKNAWDKIFINEAQNVTEYRKKFITEFKIYFSNAYNDMINEQEKVDISLRLNFNNQANFEEEMLKEIHKINKKESLQQISLIGPHLDDLQINIDNKSANIYASQGQKRSLVIALKLGMSSFIHNSLNTYPILIFDDTLAELDNNRTNKLLNHLSQKHQIFIASPTLDKYSLIKLPLLNLERNQF